MKRIPGGLFRVWILLAMAIPAVSQDKPPSHGANNPLPPPAPAASWAKYLPDGDAKELVMSRCQLCHSLKPVVSFRRPKDQWQDLVGAMIGRGAPITKREIPQIVDYLYKNFGRNGDNGPFVTAATDAEPIPASAMEKPDQFRGAYRIFVSNQESASVFVIDPATNKIAQKITGITSPDGIMFSQDGRKTFISDRVEHVVAVVDTKTGAMIKKIPVTDRPQLPVLSKDGKLLYVGIWPVKASETTAGAIDVIDTTSLEKIKTIPAKGGIHDMQVTADGNYLIVGSPMGKFLATYDLRTDQLVWEMPFDRNVQTFTAEMAADGSATRIFLNMRFPGFSIIDFATHKETARVLFPHPGGPADGELAGGREGGGYFVPTGKGSSHGINIAPDGKTMWLDAMGYDTPWFNNVYVYSLPGLKLQGHVHLSDVDGLGKPVGAHGQGHWQCFSPDGKILYVVSAGLNWMHVVDVKAMKEVARVPVGENPLHVEIVVIPK